MDKGIRNTCNTPPPESENLNSDSVESGDSADSTGTSDNRQNRLTPTEQTRLRGVDAGVEEIAPAVTRTRDRSVRNRLLYPTELRALVAKIVSGGPRFRKDDGPLATKDDNGCILWSRHKSPEGYGIFRSDKRVVHAHRFFYELANGPVEDGLELDHLCRNRACINPSHLEPVTHIENCRRGALVRHMTIERARELRKMFAAGATHKELAAHFGIGMSLVAQITTNRCWKESNSLAAKGAERP